MVGKVRVGDCGAVGELADELAAGMDMVWAWATALSDRRSVAAMGNRAMLGRMFGLREFAP